MNLKSLFPHGSNAFFNANSNPKSQVQPAEPQSTPKKTLVSCLQRKTKGSDSVNGRDRRIAVCYTIKRVRLQDEDNAMGGTKTITDSLKLAGLIPDDSPDKISITVEQEKVRTFAEEGLTLTIKYP